MDQSGRGPLGAPVIGCRAVSENDDTRGGELTPTERRLFSLLSTINESPGLKWVQKKFLHMVGRRWVHYCTRNLIDVEGMEHAHQLRSEKGVLLCSNHRSFFDMYVISAVFLRERVPWFQYQFFPVRSNFIYDGWQGLGVNMLMSGGAMYPPIFRGRGRTHLNRQAVERVVGFLQQPGVVVGMHPEGRRGKGPDPYELLRAQPGIGQMALQAKVPVLPVWIDGLSNDIVRQIASNFGPPERRGQAIVVRVGAPVDLADLMAKKGRVTVYKRAADRILNDIRALGLQVRDGH